MTDTAERITLVTVLLIGSDGDVACGSASDVACGSASEDEDSREDAIERARDAAQDNWDNEIGGDFILTLMHIDNLPKPKAPIIQVETIHPESDAPVATVETTIR